MIDLEWLPNKLETGLKSFKFKLSNSKLLCKNVLNNALQMLMTVDGNFGMFVSTECPITQKEWVKLSVDRKGPIRQYFGMSQHEKKRKRKGESDIYDNYIKRASYGVAAGSTGSNMETNITREMSPSMKQLASALSAAHKKWWKNGSKCKQNVNFNHVTFLFYLTDPNVGGNNKFARNESILDYHVDFARTAQNKEKGGNNKHEQKLNSPTVVLSLGDDKMMNFAKRYSDGNVFEPTKIPVASKVLENGSFHFLHPEDEHVIRRRLKDQHGNFQLEEKRSQFLHQVKTKSNKDDKEVKVCVSLVFREVDYRLYDKKTDILIDEEGKFIKNDRRTEEMRSRDELLCSKAKDLKNPNERNDIQEYLCVYYNKLLEYKHKFN